MMTLADFRLAKDTRGGYKAGKYSVSFNDDEDASGILELTDTTFADLSEYYSDAPKATLTD